MIIECLRVKNFKALRDVQINGLPPMSVFVGRNGSGKTTLFKVFAFLKNCLRNNVRSALNAEGGRMGFKEVVTRGRQDEAIEIEIQFRLELEGKNRLVTYFLAIREEAGRAYIEREILRYKRARYGAPYHYLDFSRGKGQVVTNEEEFDEPEKELTRDFQELDAPDILAIKGLGVFGQKFKAASAFRRLIENWHISDFHISDARGKKEDEEAYHLSSSGDNLPSVARHLYENEREIWNRIEKKMRERVPGVERVDVEPTADGGLMMRYADGSFKEPFIDRNVSDGTIKMFAYLVLLEDPKPFPILCVEEPENQLYPELMTALAEEFIQYAERGGQVFVSTHSPEFLNAVSLENVFWLEKNEGVSTVHRASDHELLKRLHAEGDPPGALWQQGFLDTNRLRT